MGFIQGLVAFLGRILISFIFIASGVHQILDWQGTEQRFVTAINDWNALMIADESLRNMLATALSWSSLLVAGAIFCQLIGGLLILLGIQIRFGAFLLILFLASATLLFHHFWMLIGPERNMQMIEFMKNMSMLGGLFILLAYGKGKKTPPRESSSPKENS